MDDDVFQSLAARAAADRRWMRRVNRHIWFTNWLDGLLEMGMVCGVLGPIGPIVVPEPAPPSDRRTLSG
jgi:hypothetical protein